MGNSIALAFYLATRARTDRRRAPDEDETSASERSGRATQPRPDGSLVWIHTGQDSAGTAARELAWRLNSERRDLRILLTTTAENRQESAGCLLSQFAPDDNLPAVRRFLDHWRPNLAIWTEPDLRPALIAEADDRSVSLFLADAHTASPDPQAWRWLRGMSTSLLSRFQKVMTGNTETAAALRRLGAQPDTLEVTGFLEEGTPAMSCNEFERDALAAGLGARPVWLAAHLSPTEAIATVDAHRHAERRAHRLLLIMVPQDPDDGPALRDRLVELGYHVALRSEGEEPDPDTQIYVADTAGEMGLWYRLAQITFLGQSLESGSGINPFEPAALGSAVIHGPHIANHASAYAKLGAVGATRLVNDAASLGAAVEALLSPDTAATMAHAAWTVCTTGAQVTDRVMEMILDELDTREAP